MRPARDPQGHHTHDYRAAIAKAVDWLGDRYLLAKPIKSHPVPPTAVGVHPVRESYLSNQKAPSHQEFAAAGGEPIQMQLDQSFDHRPLA
jgi:hypothetical protein